MIRASLKVSCVWITLLAILLSGCSQFNHSVNEAMRVGQESAMTKYLDDDEKKYYQENRDYITLSFPKFSGHFLMSGVTLRKEHCYGEEIVQSRV